VPTTLLFFVALQFVSTSMDYWFNINVDQSLSASLSLAQDSYHEVARDVSRRSADIAASLKHLGVEGKKPKVYLKQRLAEYNLSGLAVLDRDRAVVLKLWAAGIESDEVPHIPVDIERRAWQGERALTFSQPGVGGEFVLGLTSFRTVKDGPPYLLVAASLIPRASLERMEVITKGIEGYRQLLLLKKPIKSSLLVMLLIVTLLIIFSAIWFGFYVADGLTRPIDKLASAIQKVADGELDFVLEKDSDDEMGRLFDSFNQMIRDLLTSKHQVEDANNALLEINIETEKRRRYNEIILQNVTAGVISLDANGRIIMINKFAEELLKISRDDVLDKNYKSILRFSHLTILEDFFIELAGSGKASIQKPLKITVSDETLSLMVNFTKLMDDSGSPLGIVIVFDNLTELEKIQRMAAWREVARRIAHEVKNPLTPIQLSAQRLRKRYLERLEDEGHIFDQCTRTIINQVDELKHLVSEFSSFARMPAVKKSLNDIVSVTREVLVLYEEAHKDIIFKLSSQNIERFAFDLEQIKRVIVNLLDNAVAALEGVTPARIDLDIHLVKTENKVIIEISDNGCGVKDADKIRLFEPYFSTKKTGTGLGLAIASTVVADHDGYLRVKDNQPQGTRFVIELPLVGRK
jgi:two-component system nitrogen regulation sensor histidine kinase NtrY